METKYKEHIRQNLVALIESTANFPVLLVLLHSNNLLSENDIEIIKSYPDSHTKHYDMYMKLMKRDCYYTLITCLEGSENKVAAGILKASPPYNSADHQKLIETENKYKDGDFIVTYDGVTKILEILAKQPSLYDHWELISAGLVSPTSWNGLKEQKNFPVLILQTLRAWIVEKDEKATFNSLKNEINKWNPQAARILQQEKSSIQEL